MKKVLLIFSLLFLFTACQSNKKTDSNAQEGEKTFVNKSTEPAVCPVSGHSSKWEYAWCINKTGIKSRYNKNVQTCVDDLVSKTINYTECEKRVHTKGLYCAHLISLSYIEEGQNTCVKNNSHDDDWLKLDY